MAALARVWLCTEECSFVLAERITALSIRSPAGEPLARMPDGDVRIEIRTSEGSASVLTCGSDLAPELLADLARVLTEAADHPEPYAFVHPAWPDGKPAWAISSAPPDDWPG